MQNPTSMDRDCSSHSKGGDHFPQCSDMERGLEVMTETQVILDSQIEAVS